MSRLDHPNAWIISSGLVSFGTLPNAITTVLTRLNEASRRLPDRDGQEALQSATRILWLIEAWAKEHAVVAPLYAPTSNRSEWD